MSQNNFESERKEANTAIFMLEDELRKLYGQLEVQNTQLKEFQNQKASSLGTIIQEILDASLVSCCTCEILKLPPVCKPDATWQDELVRMKATLTEDEEAQIDFRKGKSV